MPTASHARRHDPRAATVRWRARAGAGAGKEKKAGLAAAMWLLAPSIREVLA